MLCHSVSGGEEQSWLGVLEFLVEEDIDGSSIPPQHFGR